MTENQNIASTATIDARSPELLRSSIDEHIVRIRPASTPLDQISRLGGSRPASAMTVDYYKVDSRKIETKIKTGHNGGFGTRRSNDIYAHTIKVVDETVFEISETILLPGLKVNDENGEPVDLVLIVLDKNDSGLVVAPVNAPYEEEETGFGYKMPPLPQGQRMVRMGRAAAELDVQTAQYCVMPRKSTNHCQIFKMQVEQSMIAKMADKEVAWDLSDQEECAIIDMRQGMEKSFLFGQRMRMFDKAKNEYIYLTGGIWSQAGKRTTVDINTFTELDLLGLCKEAFTGNTGSRRKVLLCGTEFLEAMAKIELTRVMRGSETVVRWGVEFKEIVSNFGTLLVVPSETFDQCGHAQDAMIVDPDYITKYVHIPFQAEQLDLRTSGQRNTEAVVLTEASCLVLRYPESHVVITHKPNAA